MSASKPTTFAVILVLMLSRLAASAFTVVIEHSWSVVGPGGRYGFFQYPTGPGPFDAHTVLMLGHRSADIPIPLYMVVACVVVAFGVAALFARGLLLGGPKATNPAAAGNGAPGLQLPLARPDRDVPEEL